MERVIQFKEHDEKINLIDKSAVMQCEEMYPETCKAYKEIMQTQYELFCAKQLNYGPDNISVGTSLSSPDDIHLSLTGLWFRMNDKIQRLKQLVILNRNDMVGESLMDTYQDLSVYGIIAQLVQRGSWSK